MPNAKENTGEYSLLYSKQVLEELSKALKDQEKSHSPDNSKKTSLPPKK